MSEDEFFRSWPKYMQKLLKYKERERKEAYSRTLLVANPVRAFINAKPIKLSDLFGKDDMGSMKDNNKAAERAKRFQQLLQNSQNE